MDDAKSLAESLAHPEPLPTVDSVLTYGNFGKPCVRLAARLLFQAKRTLQPDGTYSPDDATCREACILVGAAASRHLVNAQDVEESFGASGKKWIRDYHEALRARGASLPAPSVPAALELLEINRK